MYVCIWVWAETNETHPFKQRQPPPLSPPEVAASLDSPISLFNLLVSFLVGFWVF